MPLTLRWLVCSARGKVRRRGLEVLEMNAYEMLCLIQCLLLKEIFDSRLKQFLRGSNQRYDVSFYCFTENHVEGTRLFVTRGKKDRCDVICSWVVGDLPEGAHDLNEKGPERVQWREIDLQFKSPTTKTLNLQTKDRSLVPGMTLFSTHHVPHITVPSKQL